MESANCAAANMSKEMKIFILFGGNPAPSVALPSILERLCGWLFLFILLFTFAFLYLLCDITALVKLGKLD